MADTLRENRSIENFRINGQVERLEPDKIQITPASVKAYFVFEARVKVSLVVE